MARFQLQILFFLIITLSLAGCNNNDPGVSLEFSSGDYTSQSSVTLKITWSNFTPTQMKISSSSGCADGVWETVKSSESISLGTTEGKKNYSVQLKNDKDETTPCKDISVTYDKTAPTGSITVTNVSPVPSRSISLQLNWTDSGGMGEMSIKESNKCTSYSWVTASKQKTFVLSSGNGTKTISVIFRDKALNLSSCYTTSVVLEEDPTMIAGKLHIEGTLIKDAAGNVITLRGVNIADPQHLDTKPWERPGVTAASVAQDAIDNFNVNVIRIPILPGTTDYPDEGWFSKTNGGQKYFDNHIKDLVDSITAQNIYVIIDLHYISNYSDLQDEVLDFWEFMAPQYADNPYVIYEIFNEPIGPDSWSTWKSKIAQPAVNLIRTYAPDNLIIVGGPYWSSHMSGAATSPVQGDNILYTAHVYSNQSSSAWEQNFGNVVAKYPVFVTEWGFENGGTKGGTASGYGTPFLSWMESHGLSWTAWCFDNVWGPRMFDSDWNLLDGNGGMGVFVKTALQANN